MILGTDSPDTATISLATPRASPLQIVRDLREWQRIQKTMPSSQRIGFVPTMGALHAGHASLIERARVENDIVVVSLFVNPTQFNNPEDLAKYPNTWDKDIDWLRRLNVDFLLAPAYEALYADHYRYRVTESDLSHRFCGAHRPGHFDGVLTVVLKLLNLVAADNAYFGEKDYQQYLLIRDMAKSFFLKTRIVPLPTVREEDGLAMSSRNLRLSAEQRRLAPQLAQILRASATAEEARERLALAGFRVDYVEDFENRRLAAAHLGDIRLIDNVECTKMKASQEVEDVLKNKTGGISGSHQRDSSKVNSHCMGDDVPVGEEKLRTAPSRRILVFVSGSIALYKAASLVSRLVQMGHSVRVVASENALRFVGASTWEGLTGHEIHEDSFQPGQQMAHIHLGQWADVGLVYPATANLINSIASGLAHDMVTTTLCAWDFQKPLYLAPAMNTRMYENPITRDSLTRLQSIGYRLLSPEQGPLACGEQGSGRLMEPEKAFEVLSQLWSPAPASLKILVTSGGTEERIDSVRSLCNLSTGRTGLALAEWLQAQGHRVTLLRGHRSLDSDRITKTLSFTDVSNLARNLRDLLESESFDGVIHCAAVSDYAVDEIGLLPNVSEIPLPLTSQQEGAPEIHRLSRIGKLPSDAPRLTLNLRPTPKLLPQLKTWSINPKICVIGFKLTVEASPPAVADAVGKVFARGGVDFVVHNDLVDIGPMQHKSAIYQADPLSRPMAYCQSVEDLAKGLEKILLAVSDKKNIGDVSTKDIEVKHDSLS